MGDNCKPENVNVKEQINFLHYNTRNQLFDSTDSLLDGLTESKSGYGCLLDTSYNGYDDNHKENSIIFEIFHLVNIWAYGKGYRDGGGGTPSTVKIYKKNQEHWQLLKDKIQTKDNQWYLLFENLNKGVYKLEVEANYVSFTEWYVEKINESRYLIKKDNKIYGVKSELYNIKKDKFIEVEQNFQKFGVKLEELTKPINSLPLITKKKNIDNGHLYEFELNNYIKSINEV